MNNGIERLFARGPAGTSVANWINSSSAYEFRLYSATTPRTLLASVKVTRARSSSAAPPTPPSIEATPTPVPTGPGLRPTTITWTTGDGSDGLVYVSTDGGTRQIFTQGPFGSLVANWIDDHSAYEFELSSNTTPQTLLAAVKVPARPAARVPAEPSSEPTPQNVTAVRARSYLAASPNPVPAGLGSGATEISWAVGAGTGKILMSVDGAPATQFVAGTGGSLQAAPIRAGSTYEFRLYGAGTPDVLLVSIVVTRGSLSPLVLAVASVSLILLLVAVMLRRRFRKATLPRT